MECVQVSQRAGAASSLAARQREGRISKSTKGLYLRVSSVLWHIAAKKPAYTNGAVLVLFLAVESPSKEPVLSKGIVTLVKC